MAARAALWRFSTHLPSFPYDEGMTLLGHALDVGRGAGASMRETGASPTSPSDMPSSSFRAIMRAYRHAGHMRLVRYRARIGCAGREPGGLGQEAAEVALRKPVAVTVASPLGLLDALGSRGERGGVTGQATADPPRLCLGTQPVKKLMRSE
jgi:hypothetical protein